MQLRKLIKKVFWGVVGIAPLIVVIAIAIGLKSRIPQVKLLIEQAGVWAPIVYIFIKASTYVIAPLTGESIKVLSGITFGFWPGVIYTIIGDLLGGSINFWLARIWGKRIISKLLDPSSVNRVENFTKQISNWRALLLCRIILSAAYDFISYGVGLTNISYWQYLIVSAVGGIVSTSLLVALGANLDGKARMSILIIIVILILVLAIWILRNPLLKYAQRFGVRDINDVDENDQREPR